MIKLCLSSKSFLSLVSNSEINTFRSDIVSIFKDAIAVDFLRSSLEYDWLTLTNEFCLVELGESYVSFNWFEIFLDLESFRIPLGPWVFKLLS